MNLDSDDQQWLSTLIERVESNLDRKLVALESRLDQKLIDLEARLTSYTDARFAEARAQMERVETALLTEFQKWAGPMEMKIRS